MGDDRGKVTTRDETGRCFEGDEKGTPKGESEYQVVQSDPTWVVLRVRVRKDDTCGMSKNSLHRFEVENDVDEVS